MVVAHAMLLADDEDPTNRLGLVTITEHAVKVQRYQTALCISRIANQMGTTVEETAMGTIVRQWADLLEVDSKELSLEVTVSYPRDWWEAFKERWFPQWALKKWPVQMAHVTKSGKIRAASSLPDLKVIPGHRVVYVAEVTHG